VSAGDAIAVAGFVLMLVGVGLAIGPFRTPMVWSEGTLTTYQGNADPRPAARSRYRRRVAVPAVAFLAGVLLLGIAAVLAAT
jgi:hypothetical protein